MDKRLSIAMIALLVMTLFFLIGCEYINIPGTENKTEPPKYPPAYGFEVEYCEGLGYIYEYRMNDSSGRYEEYCRLSKDVECDAWDFATGECKEGIPFMLCSIKGYVAKIGVEKRENVTLTYPICIFPDNSYCKESDFFHKKCHMDW